MTKMNDDIDLMLLSRVTYVLVQSDLTDRFELADYGKRIITIVYHQSKLCRSEKLAFLAQPQNHRQIFSGSTYPVKTASLFSQGIPGNAYLEALTIRSTMTSSGSLVDFLSA